MGNAYPKEFNDAIREIIQTNRELKEVVKRQNVEIKELKKKIVKLEKLYERKVAKDNSLFSY